MTLTPGEGPPTELELKTFYPPLFSFQDLKEQVASGDLGLLKRHPDLQKRYDLWCINYLVNVRLGWGPTASRPETPSSHAEPTFSPTPTPSLAPPPPPTRPFTPIPQSLADSDVPHFERNIPDSLVKVIPNDWPYSVPPEVKHFLVWSRLPIIHSDVVPPSIWKRVEEDGLWGFTGTTEIPMRNIPPAFCADQQSDELVKETGEEVHQFVRAHWPDNEWECAWFVNPPRLQSVPGLAHIHVFARRK